VRTQKSQIFKTLVLIFFLIILIVNSKTIANSTRVRITDFASPALKTFHGFFSALGRITPFASPREENRILREKIKFYERRLEEIKMVYNENDRLKTLINFRKTIPYSTIPSQVIGRDPSNWSNSVIIDKGMTSGIKQNKAVLSTEGLVGRVVEVGRYSSKILLITDPNSKVGVLVQRNRQGGILVGRPDGRCKMVYIALDSDVAPGDKIMTAGFGSIFPKDILVGQVVKVDKEPGRLYKYAIVKTSTELSRLEEVLCIK
jgi:rod shape-determining protein MreC